MDSPATSFNRNKHLKEQFVSNLTGSSMTELISLATIPAALVLVRHLFFYYVIKDPDSRVNSLKKNDDANAGVTSWSSYMSTLIIDYLFLIIPMLVIGSVLSDWVNVSAVFFMLVILPVAAGRFRGNSTLDDQDGSLRKNLSSFRVSVIIVSLLCILAVDFKIFPRRYAKTETYGTSLMDLGVGSFVMANSLVSRQARGLSTSRLKNVLQSTSPLIVLGIARVVTTAGVDYQVHVGEYGVHWNFFFTLAAVSVLSSVINVPPNYSGIFGLLILVGYQIFLVRGLNVYLLSNERTSDIISQNKEGIYSIFGYWALYLICVQLGNYLFFGNSKQVPKSTKWARNRVLILSVSFWLLTMLLDKHVERVSRRTCNMAYVTFVLAENLQVLGLIMLSDNIPGRKWSALEAAFNRNLLGAFLLANVLTGLVNLFYDTLSASSASALAIMVIYTSLLTLVVGIADFYGFKLKFW